MSFKKFSVYVQRQTDAILKDYKNLSKAFIDDIVVYNKILKNYFKHFYTIFVLLNSFNISFNSIKLFLFLCSVIKSKSECF